MHAMRTALDEIAILGLPTNISFLRALADAPGFARGGIDTGFLDSPDGQAVGDALAARAAAPRPLALALGALSLQVATE